MGGTFVFGEKLPTTAKETVEYNNLTETAGQDRVNKVTADKSCSARYQPPHQCTAMERINSTI
jgi:hypothetical protein